MLWLALHLPVLPLEAFCAGLPPASEARPVVLIDQHRVHSANGAAAQRGVRVRVVVDGIGTEDEVFARLASLLDAVTGA